ncbi:hypothetical protein INT45_013989 [Circinella minor]|uniref:Transposase n=1 Tax=Circinella minor TaxID=1195481 RepID=A0A8H7VDX0_9FUNG|nr:hypothetical protein INT45_013989 [Circinella minor]
MAKIKSLGPSYGTRARKNVDSLVKPYFVGPNRRCTDLQIVELIDLIQNFARFRDGEAYLPSQLKKPGRPHSVLTNEHSLFLQDLYDKNPSATLKQAQDQLWERFTVAITQSGLQKHLVKCCGLTMKKLKKVTAYRNLLETIKKKMNWVFNMDKENINYDEYNFIDEAGFNLHLRRTFGRSKKGQPAKEGVSNNRGVNVSILGAIAAEGIVNLSLIKPQAVTTSKKRKLQDDEECLVSKVGT